MSTALYRRYRPDTFAQVIGQTHVTDPLRAALRANRVTHAYLFSGPRGCGKTTSARILARCLNCFHGPTDTPCGQCDSCRELATGGPGSLDVVEIDAASHGGVDDARDLRERATFAPVRDRYKIFIVDEAHMVTPQGFNALLKLVEEPPEHVKFVFATTEPERVLGTIRSRTHHYPFRLVPPDVLAPYVEQLCNDEHITMDSGVIPLVIRAGGGSVRDTLSVLDQLMAGAIDESVSYGTAVALLGYTDQALLDHSIDALAGGDGAAAYRVIERMVESGQDPRRFVEDFLRRLRDLLIISVAGEGAKQVLSDIPQDQLERMYVQARNWGPRQLSRAADLTDEALRAMTGATSPRLQLELLIGRILVPTESWAQGKRTAYLADLEESSVPGIVGLSGGGAPTPEQSEAPSRETYESEVPRRFGAREAREAYARKRQEAQATSGKSLQTATTHGATSEHNAEFSAQSPKATMNIPHSGGLESGNTRPEMPDAPTQQSSWPQDTVPRVPGYHVEDIRPEGAQADTLENGDRFTRTVSASPDKEKENNEQSKKTEDTFPVAFAHPDTSTEQRPIIPAEGADLHKEADVIRGRWSEIVDRLASTSRVVWSLLHQYGQLGAVDGNTVVILLPTAGHVSHFTHGGRGNIVAQAIHAVTGIHVEVRAEIGQVGGGRPVTAASAVVNMPLRESDSLPDEPPVYRETEAAPASESVWPQAAIPPTSFPASSEENTRGMTDEANASPTQENHSHTFPEDYRDTYSVEGENSLTREESFHESALVEPTNADSTQYADYRPGPAEAEWEPLPVKNIPPESQKNDLSHSPAYQQNPTESTKSIDASIGISTTGVEKEEGNIGPSAHDAGPFTPADPPHMQSVPVINGWSETVAVPGGEVTYSNEDPFASEGKAAESFGYGAFSYRHPQRKHHESASSEMTVTQENQPAAHPARVSAADDESASIDDIDAENTGKIGLAAVFDVLGGTVIDTKNT
ncbi:DNA polymerase III subunit gamma and tau [Schaalia sp. lx-100]|uniref:DNA polymerase III subunit gamma and tau n=1 Tax=Schaalia sp. lx-100 TaxID=2899081 RepID=UPI001E377EEB|nr:DNA polymerase III subunit gamma and tau [Schaalia sp. lx-100]